MNLLELYQKQHNKNNKDQYDKGSIYNTDKETYHSYISNFYSNEFCNINCKNFLEIGVRFGGSMKLWHDYFTNSKIYGLDIDLNQCNNLQGSRFKLIECNAYDESTVQYFKNFNIFFDIIVEDGPHDESTQLFAIKNYTKILSVGGILCIEDIQNEKSISNFIKVVPEYCDYKVVDLRSVKGRYDDLLFVVKKKNFKLFS